jgi:guanylate kinase
MNQGKLYIISAPSGAGKTSLVKQMVKDVDQLLVSVSHTTRNKREGEENGSDYFFSTVDGFREMIAEGAFLEHAQVFDNFYGTAKKSVEEMLAKGIDVILEIDWQGAEQVRTMMADSVSIFILPPSIKVLQQRLEGRGQDSADIIQRRMRDAVEEMNHYHEFDYLVVNDDFQQALGEIKSIMLSHRLEKNRQLHGLSALLERLTSN